MFVQRLKLALAPTVWRVLTASVRLPRTTRPSGPQANPVIFACLHRDIIPAILHVQPACPTLLVSKSPDGDILIRTLAAGGFQFARGSTGHEGGKAFVKLLTTLRNGHHVGLAVDGPKGPFGIIHEGVIQLSRRSQCPIVPLRIQSRHCRELGTWDRTVVPKPFSRVTVAEAGLIQVPAAAGVAEVDRYRRQVAAILLGQAEDDNTRLDYRPQENQGGSEPCLP